MGISFSRRGDRPAPGVPWRGVVVTTGIAAVGAAMLAGATASSSNPVSAPVTVASVTVPTGDQSAAVAAAVPAGTARLYGFAPPADAAPAANPQFRIAADLPSGPLGIPGVVLQAYKLAATRVAAESPQCKLPWFLLAGIGRIESGHAGGGNVDAYGNTRTKIRGPVLDGSLAGNAVIHDTDGGRFDGDTGHDRAMGPMQFIPSTWASWGSDANGDGKADPDNIFDATYSAGRYLCAGVTDIMSSSNKVAAVLRYNRSMAYVNNVLGWAAAYATGVVPTGGIPEMSQAPAEKTDAKKKPGDKTKPGEKPKPGDDSTAPSSKKPSPTPPPQNCLGALCLPPGIGPAPQPKPSPKAPKAAPKSKAPQAKQPATKKPTAKITVEPR
ncbi:lytic murein transglycosylase [Gordonia sp. (in: high G+C Gram-positive bacteria)]|uniref:lytic transglycosylase domain-containing protein n=1 Tax=Gordonia sp. (in: high G+C Gram-positive bacteria) TaxID=84139 RepID=UPI003529C92B